MNTTHNTMTKRLIAALGVAAAAAVAPALLFAGAGTAHADPFTTIDDNDLNSVTATPPGGPSGGYSPLTPEQLTPAWTPTMQLPGVQSAWGSLPQCNPLIAISGSCGGD
jgi:hypothetical protein